MPAPAALATPAAEPAPRLTLAPSPEAGPTGSPEAIDTAYQLLQVQLQIAQLQHQVEGLAIPAWMPDFMPKNRTDIVESLEQTRSDLAALLSNWADYAGRRGMVPASLQAPTRGQAAAGVSRAAGGPAGVGRSEAPPASAPALDAATRALLAADPYRAMELQAMELLAALDTVDDPAGERAQGVSMGESASDLAETLKGVCDTLRELSAKRDTEILNARIDLVNGDGDDAAAGE